MTAPPAFTQCAFLTIGLTTLHYPPLRYIMMKLKGDKDGRGWIILLSPRCLMSQCNENPNLSLNTFFSDLDSAKQIDSIICYIN